MDKAIALAEKAIATGDVPVGAIIVNSDGELIAAVQTNAKLITIQPHTPK